MPVKSEAQWRAMQAALHGKSTLGIPKSAAKEFVGDHAKKPSGLPKRKKKS